MLIYDIKRAFSPWKLLLAGEGIFLVVVLSVVEQIQNGIEKKLFHDAEWIGKFVMEALTNDTMLFFIPVISAIVFSSSFVEEYQSGILRFTLVRCERKLYIQSKALTTAISGGVQLLLGAVIFCSCVSVLFGKIELGEGLKLLLCRYFCVGSFWAVTGLLFSTITQNRFIAWGAPFMAEYLLIIFCERYFKKLMILYPGEWLRAENAWPFEGYGICVWILALTLFLMWIFYLSAERRLRNV